MIKFTNFNAAPALQIEDEIAAATRVIRSGWYVLGPEVDSFEQAWAAYCGASHAIGVGNGMDAIEIGLRALNIGEGAEVITTSMTAFATVLSIMRAGATPVLADINPETALLCPESVDRCISPRTKAIVLVHLYGHVASMNDWTALAVNRGITLIEDCAQSHGAKWDGKPAGTWGAFGAYSFYPTKNLGALGDGGALICNDTALANTAKMLRNYGQSERYHHPHIGLNSRLDEIQAAILNTRLPHLTALTTRRSTIASMLRKGLTNTQVKLLREPGDVENHVYHLFVVLCDNRDRLQKHLLSHGVETLIHYPIPIHMQPPCVSFFRDPAGLRSSEKHGEECLSLPCHPFLTDAEVHKIIDAVNAYH
jgi:dTDP-4-amino-4,6-dideoxygalactose transaminase